MNRLFSSNDIERLGTDPVRKLFFKMTIPVSLGLLLTIMNIIIDRIWIGHIPDDGGMALSAIGICTPIATFLMSLPIFVASGMSPAMSISLGERDYEKAGKVLNTSIGFSFLLVSTFCIVLLLFHKPLLLILGASAESLPFCEDYLIPLSIAFPFSNLTLIIQPALTAQGKANQGALVVFISVALNIVLDPMFIFVLGMKVKGAAIATCISGIVALAVGLLLLRKQPIGIRVKSFLPNWALLRPILALGFSTWISLALDSVVMFIYNFSLQRYGGDAAVGAMAMYNIPILAMSTIISGLALGAQPLISYNYGKKDFVRLKSVNRYFIFSSFILSTIIWAAVIFFNGQIWHLVSNGTFLINFATTYCIYFNALMMLAGLQIPMVQIIKSLGKINVSIFLSLLKRVFVLIPLLLALPAIFKGKELIAVLLSSPISEAIACIITCIIFIKIIRNLGNNENRDSHSAISH